MKYNILTVTKYSHTFYSKWNIILKYPNFSAHFNTPLKKISICYDNHLENKNDRSRFPFNTCWWFTHLS